MFVDRTVAVVVPPDARRANRNMAAVRGETIVYSIAVGGSYRVVTHVSPSRVKTQPSSAMPLALCTIVHPQSGIQSYSLTGQSRGKTRSGGAVRVRVVSNDVVSAVVMSIRLNCEAVDGSSAERRAAASVAGVSALRVRLDLSYDGTGFSGWASQPGLRTVQGTLAAALGTVLRIVEPSLVVAGRTDAGVHARGQVAHFDVASEAWQAARGRMTGEPGDVVVRRLSGVLPPDLVVHRARVVPAEFDARFSALSRRYAYRLADDVARLDPLRRSHVVRHRTPLDAAAMHRAARALVGEHDFAAYCKPRPGATTIRTLQVLDVGRHEDGADAGLVLVTVQADAFCHTMVRSLVGALLVVGAGGRPESWPGELLVGGVRGSVVAPAHGLTLEAVDYPADEDLAARGNVTRARRAPIEPDDGA